MLGWMAIMVGCATHHPRETPSEETQQLFVTLEAEFGAVEADGQILQESLEADLTIQASLQPVRRFRDGSVGSLFVVSEASLTVDGEPVPLELAGRSAELRTFPNGEILDFSWGEKLSGPDRYLDVFGVVLPAVSPSPPSLEVGAEARRRIIWPFKSGRTLRWDNAVDAVWENEGEVEIGTRRSWKLSYEGPWSLEGKARFVEPIVTYRGKGRADGHVWMDAEAGTLIRHQFDWSREVIVEGLSSIHQQQSFRGVVEVSR